MWVNKLLVVKKGLINTIINYIHGPGARGAEPYKQSTWALGGFRGGSGDSPRGISGGGGGGSPRGILGRGLGCPKGYFGEGAGVPRGVFGGGGWGTGGLGWTVKVGYHVASKRPSDRSPRGT